MKSRGYSVFAGLWLGAMGAFIAAVAFHYFTRGEVASAFVSLGGAAFFFGLVIPLFRTVPGRVTPRIQPDGQGTTFRPDLGVDIPVQISLAGLVTASVLTVILLPLGRFAIPVPSNMRYALPFTTAIIAVCGTPLLWRNLRRGSSRYLRLTVDGFEVADGWSPRSANWSSLEDIASEAPNQKTPTPGVIAFVMADDAVWTLTALAFTPGGTALRDLVRFYWQHPERRDELIDGRAEERLAARL